MRTSVSSALFVPLVELKRLFGWKMRTFVTVEPKLSAVDQCVTIFLIVQLNATLFEARNRLYSHRILIHI